MFFCFWFSACSLVLFLNHNIRFFASLLVFSLLFCGFCCFGILLFLKFGYLSKTSLKNGHSEALKLKTQKKTDTLTRTVSTGVFTNSVFLFCVSLMFACFAENTITRVVSAKQNPPQQKKENFQN